MPHQLWGRAEAIRTTLRSVFTAGAPLVFGYVCAGFGGGSVGLAGATGNEHPNGAQLAAANARALGSTFLVMLLPLALAGVILLVLARRTYPRDVATAMAADRRMTPGGDSATAA
jgi:hypothetical protein